MEVSTKVASAVSHPLVFDVKEAQSTSSMESDISNLIEPSRKSPSSPPSMEAVIYDQTENSIKTSPKTSSTKASQGTSSTSPEKASRKTSSSNSSTESKTNSKEAVVKLLDSLVGVWKLQKSENFDNYLKAQGVGCVARALVSFLDLKIIIERRRKGLRLTIHDYVSEFKVGVAQPLLEHPVTKRKDQMVIVKEEGGKLVCRIWEESPQKPGDRDNDNDNNIVGHRRNRTKDTSSSSSSSSNGHEVVTLEMVDNDEQIKQTLEFDKVVAYRWYTRDPNAVADVAAAEASSAAEAAAVAAGAKTKDMEGKADSGAENGARSGRRRRSKATKGQEEEEGEGEEDEEETREGERSRERDGIGNGEDKYAERGINNNNDNSDTERRPRRRRGGQQRKLQCLIA